MDKIVGECKLNKGTFLRSKVFEADKTAILRFYTTLYKKTEYTFSLCTEHIEGKDVLLKIYDKKGEFLYSSYEKDTKTYHNRLSIKPFRSGVFYVKIQLKNQKDENGKTIQHSGNGCGAVIVEMEEGLTK